MNGHCSLNHNRYCYHLSHHRHSSYCLHHLRIHIPHITRFLRGLVLILGTSFVDDTDKIFGNGYSRLLKHCCLEVEEVKSGEASRNLRQTSAQLRKNVGRYCLIDGEWRSDSCVDDDFQILVHC